MPAMMKTIMFVPNNRLASLKVKNLSKTIEKNMKESINNTIEKNINELLISFSIDKKFR